MFTNKIKNTYTQTFGSISELTEYIASTPKSTAFHGSMQSQDPGSSWTGTPDLPTALTLMREGYDVDIEPLAAITPTRTRQTQHNSPYGAYASVPRYLTGQPNSMVAYKSTPAKVRVITLYKDICFHGGYSTEDILTYGKKAVQIVQALESAGVRVNLNVYAMSTMNRETIGFIVPIKKAGERISLRKMTFAIAHPSMLRRIFLAVIERFPCTENFSGGYGSPDAGKLNLPKDSYNIPKDIKDVQEFVNTILK